MLRYRPTKCHRTEAGYTMIEIVVVLCLTSIIALGATVANAQTITQVSRNNEVAALTRQVLNAVHYISRDAQMAQSITTTTSLATANITITWETWDHVATCVTYYTENNTLKRLFRIGEGSAQEMLIAQDIDPDSSSIIRNPLTGELEITITARSGSGRNSITISRQKSITPRAEL
ncbi:MAG: type II secretion system GspH family protein [Dehalococcoidales bacterium]|nr:type II secretion system GspH family protein [Dehalococcoidales bacterium]